MGWTDAMEGMRWRRRYGSIRTGLGTQRTRRILMFGRELTDAVLGYSVDTVQGSGINEGCGSEILQMGRR